MHRLRFSALLVFLSLAQLAEAQDRHLRLDFDAAEGCPDEGAFSDEVAARLGRIGVTPDGSDAVVVRMVQLGEEAMVTLEFGGTTRVFRDPSCEVAAEAAVTALAVWLDESNAPAAGTDEPRHGVLGGGVEDPRVLGGLLGERVADDVRVVVTGDFEYPNDGVALHLETNTGVGTTGARFFERLCMLPCDVRVPRGLQQLGIADGNGIARPLDQLVELDGDSEIHIDQDNPSGSFKAGGTFAALGIIALIPAAVMGVIALASDTSPRFNRIAGVTLGVATLFTVGGILTMRFSDAGGIDVSVRPLGS